MVDAGVTDDVLIPFNLVGGAKLERLAALLRRVAITVTVDDAQLLRGLAGAAVEAGRELAVLVDCDTGLGRTGVRSVEAGRRAGARGRAPRRASFRRPAHLPDTGRRPRTPVCGRREDRLARFVAPRGLDRRSSWDSGSRSCRITRAPW